MPNLVCDHIGCGKVARRSESLVELTEERQIEVDLLIGRAIERPAGRRCRPTGGLDGPLKEHKDRLAILAASTLEDTIPRLFGVPQHNRNEFCRWVIGWGSGWDGLGFGGIH